MDPPLISPKRVIDMSKNTEAHKKRSAYHEAGHVVADILLGLSFKAVSLRMKEQSKVEIKDGKEQPVIHVYTEGVVWSEERTESVNKDIFDGKLDLREAIADMAGPVAESMLVGKIDDMARLGARDDVQGIMGCCRAALSPGQPIENWTASAMEDDIARAVGAQALELLNENWANVEAVANALMKYRYLTEEEARKLVKRP